MTDENGYNGWSNWDTWVLNLWIDNDYSTYMGKRHWMTELARRDVRIVTGADVEQHCKSEGILHMVYIGESYRFDSRAVDFDEIAENWTIELEEIHNEYWGDEEDDGAI